MDRDGCDNDNRVDGRRPRHAFEEQELIHADPGEGKHEEIQIVFPLDGSRIKKQPIEDVKNQRSAAYTDTQDELRVKCPECYLGK